MTDCLGARASCGYLKQRTDRTGAGMRFVGGEVHLPCNVLHLSVSTPDLSMAFGRCTMGRMSRANYTLGSGPPVGKLCIARVRDGGGEPKEAERRSS